MVPSMDRTLTPTRTEARPSPSAVAMPTRPSRFAGQRVHFIGIGGSGMSGLARMLLDAGGWKIFRAKRPGPPFGAVAS